MYYTAKYQAPVFKKYDGNLKPYIVRKPLRLYELVLSYTDKKDLGDINKILGTEKSSEDITESIFTDKVNLKRAAMQNLISQIRERKIIEYAQQKGILGNICEVETAILRLDSIAKDSYSPMGWSKTSLIGHIGKLDKESRDRTESSWKDLVDLRKELLEEVKGYRNAVRLEGMIQSDNRYS